MVDQFENSEEELGQLFTTWTCALGPDALTNYQPAIDLARQHVAPDEKDAQKLQFLGAIYVRAKRFEEARAALVKVVAGDGTASVSPAYSLYLLAMTEHELGNDAVATKQLQAANEFADKELLESPIWNRETTLKLLRDEAESLIEPSIERRETVENE